MSRSRLLLAKAFSSSAANVKDEFVQIFHLNRKIEEEFVHIFYLASFCLLPKFYLVSCGMSYCFICDNLFLSIYGFACTSDLATFSVIGSILGRIAGNRSTTLIISQ